MTTLLLSHSFPQKLSYSCTPTAPVGPPSFSYIRSLPNPYHPSLPRLPPLKIGDESISLSVPDLSFWSSHRGPLDH